MAELSNQLLPVAVLIYVAAMVGYLLEYTFGSRGAVARTAVRPGQERELVAARRGSAPVEGVVDGDTPADAPVSQTALPPSAAVAIGPGRAAWFGRAALVLTGFAILVHAAVLVTRGLAVGRVPWG